MIQGYIPSVVEKTDKGITTFDLYSRLLDDRIIILGEDVNNRSAINIITMLLYLDAKDQGKTIHMYINSPGGSVIDGLAIVDTMKTIKSPVSTIVCGMAASMGAVIAASGAKGMRMVLPHSEIMIHQIMSGNEGGTQARDLEISLRHTLRLEQSLNKILSDASGKTMEEVKVACDRDKWMTAEESIEFGLSDTIVKKG